ncbi:hypothetical protein B7P43_G15913 [Cryptotermes secundus]|uniref:Reverse transcriptase domain-containing protein n=1 Tax=Cryptotermes secundus TaxID=105785 RepID=A0A2J7Q5G3_9NEOP|nr:hypothetical protein B7P43_G15913 [Cryptotermes secundus]
MVEQDLLHLTLEGYLLGSSFCRRNLQRGGVCIFIKKDKCFNKIDISCHCTEKDLEICAVQLGTKSSNLIILGLYRSPSGDFNQFLKGLDAALKYLYNPKSEFLICGDINIDYLSDSNRKKQLNSLLKTYNLVHTVNFATRIQKDSSSAIDNIFVDITRFSSSSTVPIINGLSDHDAQYLMMNNIALAGNSIYQKQKIRKINSETIMQFQHLLKSETWECVYKENDTNDKYNSFLSTFLNIFEASFPIKYKSVRKLKNDWITQGIKISCKHKRTLYVNSRNNNNPNIRVFYVKYCKILRNVIKEAKKQHYRRLIAKSDNKIKMTWNIIKRETGKMHLTDQMPSLLAKSEKAKDLEIVANDFNKFFLTVAETLNLHQMGNENAFSFLKDAFPINFPSIKIIPTSEAEIKNIIHTMKTKNSSGFDEVTSKILKACSDLISCPLTHICNHSLYTGIFPDRLKISIVKPVFKKGDKYSMTNYRPISLLSTFSKILEKVMYSRINQHMHCNNILVPEQYGFRKGVSTEDAAFKLTDNVLKSIDQKRHVGGIFCDLAKAFDCVNHEILLSKLQFYGIRGTVLKWFKSYLTNRKQKVEIKSPKYTQNFFSNWRTVKHGVPQGSVLGPLLFIIYINDLPPTINFSSEPIIFADDTSVIISSKMFDDFCAISNRVLSHMNKWFNANRLALNLNKTNVMKFTTNNAPHYVLNIGYNGKYIEETVNTKFLGLQIDSHLSWSNHIDKLIPKLSGACYAVRSMFHVSNTETLKLIYFAYFHSVMKYGIIFWGNSSYSQKIFILQKKIVRIMAGVKPRESCKNIFKRLEILTLPCEYIFSLMIFIVKNQEFFPTNSTIHNVNTRNKNQLHRPVASLSCFQKSAYYTGIKIFNNLPPNITTLIDKQGQFKVALKRYLITHSFYSVEEFMLPNNIKC